MRRAVVVVGAVRGASDATTQLRHDGRYARHLTARTAEHLGLPVDVFVRTRPRPGQEGQ